MIRLLRLYRNKQEICVTKTYRLIKFKEIFVDGKAIVDNKIEVVHKAKMQKNMKKKVIIDFATKFTSVKYKAEQKNLTNYHIKFLGQIKNTTLLSNINWRFQKGWGVAAQEVINSINVFVLTRK